MLEPAAVVVSLLPTVLSQEAASAMESARHGASQQRGAELLVVRHQPRAKNVGSCLSLLSCMRTPKHM
eukprot:3352557-Amphidinium_carterae.1